MANFLTKQDSFYLLLETGDKFLLQLDEVIADINNYAFATDKTPSGHIVKDVMEMSSTMSPPVGFTSHDIML